MAARMRLGFATASVWRGWGGGLGAWAVKRLRRRAEEVGCSATARVEGLTVRSLESVKMRVEMAAARSWAEKERTPGTSKMGLPSTVTGAVRTAGVGAGAW